MRKTYYNLATSFGANWNKSNIFFIYILFNESHTMDIETLKTHLIKIDKINNNEWMETLTPRKIKELEFHDRARDPEFKEKVAESSDTFDKFYGNRKYYRAVGKSTDYTYNWLKKNSKDKVFLDYACGNGGNAIRAVKAGAKYAIGMDISPVSVEIARKTAIEEGLEDRCYFLQADAENTMLPENSIDTVVCSGVLHHLDLSYAFPELRRILKPGGKILAIEALDYNPAIKLYRKLTPDMRTEWEKAHILSLSDVKFASRFFTIGAINYWHVVSYIGGKFPILMPLLQALDAVLTKIPYIQMMGWIFTFELIKPPQK